MSDGREAMPISIVNYYDNTMPPPLEYSAQRIPTTGVPLNLDTNFLCGCDCDDDCWVCIQPRERERFRNSDIKRSVHLGQDQMSMLEDDTRGSSTPKSP